MAQYLYNSNIKQHFKGEIIVLDNRYPRDNGWTWFILEDAEGDTFHFSGNTNVYLMQGLQIEFDAIPDKLYNGEQQYRIDSLIQCLLTNRRDIVRYLSSRAFPHIGERKAGEMFDAYGADIFDKVKDDLDDVVATCKLSDKQAVSLYEGIVQESSESKLRRVLPSLSDTVVRKIVKSVKSDMSEFIDSIQRNPYQLLDYNVSFRQLDRLLISDLHWAYDNDIRMLHIFNHTLSQHMVSEYDNTGYLRERSTKSVYLNLSKDFMFYFNYVCRGKNAYPMPDGVDSDWFYTQLEKAIASPANILKKITHVDAVTHQVEYHLYDKQMYFAKRYLEKFVVDEIKGYSGASRRFQAIAPVRSQNFQAWLTLGNNGYSRLNKGQQTTLRNVIGNRVSFITGGPGRGKTTLVRTLIEAWNFINNGVCETILLAPTGKAVKKLKDDTNYGECQTIARFVLMNTLFEKEDDELLLMDGITTVKNGLHTLIVIDETSMLDYPEAAQLLQLVHDCTIVFLGDVNQLAPIEPGCFFSDMQTLNLFKFNVLTQNMRTNVAILSDNNDKILDGTLSPRDYDEHFGFDFTIPDMSVVGSQNEADRISCDKVIGYYQSALQNGYDMSDILLLSPARKGTYLGVNALNSRLQDLINPLFAGDVDQYKVRNIDGAYCLVHKGFECPGVKLGDSSVRIMDRVMNTKNNAKCEWKRYEKNIYGADEVETGYGLYNGDVGTVERYVLQTVHSNAQVVIRMDDGRYFVMDVLDFKNAFVIAYATTVHKAQGSEASVVIVALSEASLYYPDGFLTKNLLYTATTRAKEEVQICGSKAAFDICLQTAQIIDKSTLVEDIQQQVA